MSVLRIPFQSSGEGDLAHSATDVFSCNHHKTSLIIPFPLISSLESFSMYLQPPHTHLRHRRLHVLNILATHCDYQSFETRI